MWRKAVFSFLSLLVVLAVACNQSRPPTSTPTPTVAPTATRPVPTATPTAVVRSTPTATFAPTATPTVKAVPSPTPSAAPTETAVVIRPSEGGQISVSGTGTALDNRVKVTIPPGAIQGQTQVTLRVGVVEKPAPAHTVPVGAPDTLLTAVGTTVRIEPSAPVTFAKPITVTVPFDKSLVPAGFDPQRLIALVGSTSSTGVRSWELVKDVKVDAGAGVVTFQLAHLSEATALAEEGKTDLAKEAVFQAFKDVGGEVASSIDSFALDPLITYFTTPDDKALDAALLKALEGVRDAAFPTLGLSIKAGKVIIGTAQYTVEQMYQAGGIQQRESLIFGGSPDRLLGDLNNPYSKASFFGIKSVEGQGITKENIGQTIKTEARLKELWGYYKSEVGTVLGQGPIDQAWPSMLEYWRDKRAAIVLDDLFAALQGKSREIVRKLGERRQALATVPTPAKPTGTATTWKLVDTKIDPSTPAAIPFGSWTLTKTSVTESNASRDGTAKRQITLTWDPAPDTFVSGQPFSITIKGSGSVVNRMSVPGSGLEAKFEAGAGLDVIEDTSTGWGGITPGPSDAGYAWVNSFGARVDRDDLAQGGVNRTYKFKVFETYSASDVYLTLRVGGRAGDDANGTVTFHWRRQDASAATWKMLPPKIEDKSAKMNTNRDIAMAKDSAAFNYYPPQGDSKGLFYPNTQAKITWDLPPETLTAGQTFTMAFKGSGVVLKPGQNDLNEYDAVGVKVKVGTWNFNYARTGAGWNGYNADPERPEAFVSWHSGQLGKSGAVPFWGVNQTYKFTAPQAADSLTITLTIDGGFGYRIDSGGIITFQWQKQ